MPKQKDSSDGLKEYIRRNMKKGYTRESLKWALVSQGYSRIEIEKALKEVDVQIARETPRSQKKEEPVEMNAYEPEISGKRSFWSRLFG